MATPLSERGADRAGARRRVTSDEALDHAAALIASDGVGAVTVSEIARRMGIKPPSLYKHFPSLHAIFDALFARGGAELNAAVDTAVRDEPAGLHRLLAASREVLRWAVANPGHAQLMFWRPVPGFVPSAAAFAPSQGLWSTFRADLATAVAHGDLVPAADSDDGLRMPTVVISGLASQQMANDPDGGFADGVFTRHTDDALQMFVAHYSPDREDRP